MIKPRRTESEEFDVSIFANTNILILIVRHLLNAVWSSCGRVILRVCLTEYNLAMGGGGGGGKNFIGYVVWVADH